MLSKINEPLFFPITYLNILITIPSSCHRYIKPAMNIGMNINMYTILPNTFIVSLVRALKKAYHIRQGIKRSFSFASEIPLFAAFLQ